MERMESYPIGCALLKLDSVFGTEGSILWTIAVAAYLFTHAGAFSKWPAVAKWLVPVFHIGIPQQEMWNTLCYSWPLGEGAGKCEEVCSHCNCPLATMYVM